MGGWMQRVRERDFEHEGRKFEIKAQPTEQGWEVRLFENMKMVANLDYAVSHEVATDARPWDLIGELMDCLERDVKRGWTSAI
jgi:hypothetical protein